VKGVTDCLSESERSGFLGRHEPVGYDRHGQRYWFLCRRIFVWVYCEISFIVSVLLSVLYDVSWCQSVSVFEMQLVLVDITVYIMLLQLFCDNLIISGILQLFW